MMQQEQEAPTPDECLAISRLLGKPAEALQQTELAYVLSLFRQMPDHSGDFEMDSDIGAQLSRELGWKGKQVRHSDGRSGVIAAESISDGHCHLSIAVEGSVDVLVQLSQDGKDSGTLGWEWLCESFLGKPAWLPLGDQSK